MPYQHDVFISYRRDEDWTPWTRDHFKRVLRPYLKRDLGREPDIFLDERIEIGADWIDSLGENLAKSKVLVALFSKDYFGSDWCVHELDLVVERARRCESGNLPEARLIIPVVVHDGEQIPDPVARIQRADISKYWIVCIQREAPEYTGFSIAIKALSPCVARAVETAPAFDDKWIEYCKARFGKVYKASVQRTRVAPTQFKLKDAPPPTVPPQIKP
jgi:hypothetical protein